MLHCGDLVKWNFRGYEHDECENYTVKIFVWHCRKCQAEGIMETVFEGVEWNFADEEPDWVKFNDKQN